MDLTLASLDRTGAFLIPWLFPILLFVALMLLVSAFDVARSYLSSKSRMFDERWKKTV